MYEHFQVGKMNVGRQTRDGETEQVRTYSGTSAADGDGGDDDDDDVTDDEDKIKWDEMFGVCGTEMQDEFWW
jgi:hypothetical protein